MIIGQAGEGVYIDDLVHRPAEDDGYLGELSRMRLEVELLRSENAELRGLVPGTCRMESMHGYTDHYVSTRYTVELSCHTLEDWPDSEPPSYCPWCGRKVER